MRYVAYCDGASRKDRRGGWGATIKPVSGDRVDLFGGEEDTTNNRMEMMAVIETLWYLPEGSSVDITTDSKIIVQGVNDYLEIWERARWRTGKNKPLANLDLWQELKAAMARHKKVRVFWVKGHSGHPLNERADTLAAMGVPKLKPVAKCKKSSKR